MKAVVFSHFHHKIAEYNQQLDMDDKQHLGAEEENVIITSVLRYYKAYLKCENIGLVYVYVDAGVRQILDHLFKGSKKINLDINELAFEQTVRNILKMAVEQALRDLSNENPSFNPRNAPKFQFIGLPHLANLIASLYRIKPELVKSLAGKNTFTYDAPKFVEAVIRLARSNDPLLSGNPVLRFDQDVEVNQESIDALLNKIQNSIIRRYGFSFFSGGYGRLDGVKDPINDYAVRCHWLADIVKYANEPPYYLIPNGERFLRDIGEFGATSIPNSKNISPSTAMKDYLDRPGINSTNRDSEQVISGAGLYMSRTAILRLPPFMNFENNIIWVDDHLKRRLHEVIGDLATADLEHVEGSLFPQDRYPEGVGIQLNDREWAQSAYFYRLVSGCILHALITNRTGQLGELARFVETFLNTQRKKDPSRLEQSFMQVARKTVDDLLEIWINADYGNAILSDWAKSNQVELQQGKGKLAETINAIVQDAIRYCKLVQNWNSYVFAIQQLVPHDAYWLFRSAD